MLLLCVVQKYSGGMPRRLVCAIGQFRYGFYIPEVVDSLAVPQLADL